MVQVYKGLAGVYDYLLSGVNYREWADYLEEIFAHFQVLPRRLIIDLACGTGNSTFPWAEKGYAVFGVDISPEMLGLARQKARAAGLEIKFYQQDMRNLQLPFQADVIVLYQDGLNYLLTREDLKKALQNIRAALRPGGYFIFNLNLVEKLPVGTMPEVSWFEDEDEGITLIWESCLEPGKKIWKIKFTAFVRKEKGLYKKIQEEHRERSYSRAELEPILLETGWQLKSCYRAFTLTEPLPADRNIFYVLRREG
ncbi:MAG: class I SAM-dependent methyltransferase [Firmicutes bacterium]|nr:class I SAM-dependent methyltransferase [Bacillota bacterium]